MMMWLVLLCAVTLISGEEIIFQTGRVLKTVEGNEKVFATEFETSINKLYQAPWNQDNGATHFWGYQPTFPIYEADSDTKLRTLIRFDDLDHFIKSNENTTVLESDMTLTFINSGGAALMEVCFVTLPWDYDYETEATK